MTQEKMQIINDLIVGESLCVLATSDGIEPYTCLMSFFADHAVMKFYFLSRNDSRKSKNMKKNPHVSILIDRRDESQALTIQGVYSPIKREQTIEAITKLYLMKYPHLKTFAEHPDTELIRVEGKSGVLSLGPTDTFFTKFSNT